MPISITIVDLRDNSPLSAVGGGWGLGSFREMQVSFYHPNGWRKDPTRKELAMTTVDVEKICAVLERCLVSPNVVDSNLEPANLVDGLAQIAGAIIRLANAVESLASQQEQAKLTNAVQELLASHKNFWGRPTLRSIYTQMLAGGSLSFSQLSCIKRALQRFPPADYPSKC